MLSQQQFIHLGQLFVICNVIFKPHPQLHILSIIPILIFFIASHTIFSLTQSKFHLSLHVIV